MLFLLRKISIREKVGRKEGPNVEDRDGPTGSDFDPETEGAFVNFQSFGGFD